MRTKLSALRLSKNQMTRLVVWLLFATILLGGALLGDSDLGRGTETFAAQPAQTQLLEPVPPSVYDTPFAGESTPTPEEGSQTLAAGPVLAANGGLKTGPNNSIDYLPAWRWTDLSLEVAGAGLIDIQGGYRAMGSNIAGFAFIIASVIWSALLGLLKFGLSADFLSQQGISATINNGVAALSGKFIWLLGLLWVVVLVRAIRSYMKTSNLKEPLTGFIIFTLAMGGLFAVGNASDGATDASTKGTMPWIAQKVTGSLDTAAASLGGGFGITGNQGAEATVGGTQGKAGDVLTCAAYVDKLYDRYNDANNHVHPNSPTLLVASKMWQTTLVNSWTVAQFGAAKDGQLDLGARVYCRALERQGGVSPSDQAIISAQAGTGSAFQQKAFGPYTNKDEAHQFAMTGFAACSYINGQWGLTDEFNGQPSASSNKLETADCSGEFAKGESSESAKGGYSKNTAFRIFFKYRDSMGADTDAHAASKAWNDAYYGANTGDRVTQGILAVIIAIIFFFSLGFIALGMVVAQFMLILLLLLFPLTMVFLGMRSPNGMRMLKLTGTTAASKFLFALLLSFLTEVITLAQRLVAGVLEGGGLFGQILYGMMPVIALVVVRKVLSQVGLGDIMKPTGALSFMAASSLAATRDQKLVSMVKSANAGGGSLASKAAKSMPGASKALDKMDRMASAGRWTKGGRAEAAKEREKAARAKEKNQRLRERSRLERHEKITNFRESLRNGHTRTSEYLNSLRGNPEGIHGLAFRKRAADAGTLAANLSKDIAGRAMGGLGVAGNGLLKAGEAGLTGAAGVTKLKGMAAIGAGGALSVLGAGALPLALGVGALGAGMAARKIIDKRNAVAEDYTVKGDTYAANTVQAERNIERNAQMIARSTGVDRANKEFSYVSNILTHSRINHVGESFSGFGTVGQQAGAMESYAATMGLKRNEVVVDRHGLMTINYMDRAEIKSRGDLQAMSNGVVWLDEATRQRRDGETDESYTARMHVTLASRGLMTQDGEHINVFEKEGFDTKDPETLEKLKRWMKGEIKIDKLDRLVYTASDSAAEARLVRAAERWVGEQEAMFTQIGIERDIALVEAVKNAEEQSSVLQKRIAESSSAFQEANSNFSLFMMEKMDKLRNASGEEAGTIRSQISSLRQEWDSKASEAVTAALELQDTLDMLRLDVKAPMVDSASEIVNLAESSVARLAEHAKQMEQLQARAFTGDPQAVGQFQEALGKLFALNKETEALIGKEIQERDMRIRNAQAAAAADIARTGTKVTVKKASDYLRKGSRFPAN